MKQYIYVLKPTRSAMLSEGPTETEASIVQQHVTHLERHAEAGAVLLAGRTQTNDEQTFGIVILRAETESKAEAMMLSDPAVAEGVMSAQLFPYQVAVVSDAILG